MAGRITSEPFGKFSEFIAKNKASVPLAQLTAYLVSQYFANLSSNSFTLLPFLFFNFLY